MIRCLAAAIALLAIAVPPASAHDAEIFATDNTATIPDANDPRLDAGWAASRTASRTSSATAARARAAAT